MTAVVLMLLLVPAVAWADNLDPEPYDPSEFPQWALDIRRGSVITFGAVPVVLLLTRIVYDVGRFAIKSIEAGQPDGAYAPLFFASADSTPLDDTDRRRMLTIGVSGAAVVALIDYFLGLQENSH